MSENNNVGSKNARTSKNRNAVIDILEKAKIPLTIEYIYDELRRKNEKISLSTVYRVMERLTSNGTAIKAIVMDDNKARYELCKNGHKHYMICVKCSKMIPIENCPIKELEENITKTTGFNITGHKLEIYGECSSCAK